MKIMSLRHRIALAVCMAVAVPASISGCNASCESTGRRLNAGISGKGNCVSPTRDGGKPCTDPGDCEFACWAPDGAKAGEPAAGQCAEWPIQFGCHAGVIKGIAQVAMCVD